MEELAKKVQLVINTLTDLDIKSSYDNMNKLLGSQQLLAQIRDELNARAQEMNRPIGLVPEVNVDGNPDSE